jgi:hypothetical protein
LVERGLDAVGDERERRAAPHLERLARVVGQHEHRGVLGRLLAPQPVHASSHGPPTAVHLAAHDVRADTARDLIDDLRVGAALAAVQSLLGTPTGGLERHSCRRIPPSPIGLSTRWFGPATKPSSDIEISQV